MTKILIEGLPGIGKTTVANRCVDLLIGSRFAVHGFTTSEMREGGRRVGFRVEAIGGESAVLAHVDFAGPPTVGSYGVDLTAFERVALPTLRSGPAVVLVIDELGKMELASAPFRQQVEEVFAGTGRVLATVHRQRHPFTDRLKAQPDVELVQVTAQNRETLAAELITALTRPE